MADVVPSEMARIGVDNQILPQIKRLRYANLHEISGLEVTVAVGSEDPDVELDDAPG
jgi:hypothetical protein